MPKVSVIMPAYNVERYVAEGVRSVVGQSFDDWELVVVDDGSTDRTGEIVGSFAAKDRRIVLITQANAGVSVARNRGMEKARGEWVAFLDADDLWQPTYLERMLSRQADCDADVIFCDHRVLAFDCDDYKVHTVKTPEGAAGAASESFLADVIRKRLWIFIGALMVKKSLLGGAIAFTPGCVYGEDSEFINKVLAAGRACYVPEVQCTYRLRPRSATNRKWEWQVFVQDIYGLERAREFVRTHCSESCRPQAMSAFEERISFEKFRLVYNLIKWGDYPAARRLLADDWGEDITKAGLGQVKIRGRLKVWLARQEREVLWRVFSFGWRLLVRLRLTRLRHIGEMPY